MDRAYAEGAAIISDDGTTVTFHPQCPKCGFVERSTTMSGYCRFGTAELGGHGCPKCFERYKIVLHRSR